MNRFLIQFRFAIFLLLFQSCSNPSKDYDSKKWAINALEVQVAELNEQNNQLNDVLLQMNPAHISIRNFTSKLVDKLEDVKMTILKKYRGKKTKAYTRVAPKNGIYPMTFTFENKEIPKRLSQLVANSIESFDNHPRTDGHLQKGLRQMLPDRLDEESFQDYSIFKGMTVGDSIELLELIQTRILIEENKYLLSQFDHALNVKTIRDLGQTDSKE